MAERADIRESIRLSHPAPPADVSRSRRPEFRLRRPLEETGSTMEFPRPLRDEPLGPASGATARDHPLRDQPQALGPKHSPPERWFLRRLSESNPFRPN